MDLIVPDSIEPVVGWKALRVNGLGELDSPQQAFRWNPRRRVEATCDNVTYAWVARKGGPLSERRPMPHRLPTHGLTTTATIITPITPPWDVPEGIDTPQTVLPEGMHWSWEPTLHTPASHNGCSCGIYMVNDPTDTAPYINNGTVLAQVSGWGNVIRAERGARVQYAYPRLIVAPEALRDQAEQAADLYKVPLQIWEPGMSQIDFTRTVVPTLNIAKAAAATNQFAQAQKQLQAHFTQVNQTLKAVMPEPQRSSPSPFLPMAVVTSFGAVATIVIRAITQASYFGWMSLLLSAMAFICLLADFLVFRAREKAAGR